MISVDMLILGLVFLVSAMLGLAVARVTRNVTFASPDTDNEKQVRAAARAGEWRWPSDMHKYGSGKTVMKDVLVLGLAVMQRVLRDRTTDYPLVVLCVVANAVSAVLVFVVASSYWNTGVGLLLWALLVTCVWPYQLAIWGAHICVAQTFFLAAVLFIQLADGAGPTLGLVSYSIAGIAIGLTLFSSASSRKYLPLLAGAFIYSQRETLWSSGLTLRFEEFLSDGMGLAIISVSAVLVLGAILLRFSYKRIVTDMYFERTPAWLNRKIPKRREFGLQHYIARASEIARDAITLCFVIVLYLLVSFLLSGSNFFYWSQLSLGLGVFAVVFLLTYPNVWSSLRAYYGWVTWSRLGQSKFHMYRKYFHAIGKPIKDEMRGGGLAWIVRYFGRVTPVHAIFYCVCLFLLAPLIALGGIQLGDSWKAVAIVILSVSPVLVGEITRGPQVARAYYPGFLGLLLLVAYVAFQVDHTSALPVRAALWSVAAVGILVSAGWHLWMFLDDVLPTRMAPARLGETLETLGIKEFYTYDTPYNDAFVQALAPTHRERYKIHYINSLKEVEKGYVVVPGTSAKAANMVADKYAIDHGDFDQDPELNHLIESKAITRYSVASFKTFGTSRILVHEDEVATYRDLILQEIRDEDRWRGRAWILDAGKLHAARQPG